MPTILGVTVIGLIFTLIFNPSGGPAASVWGAFGTSSAFFGDPHLAMAAGHRGSVWARHRRGRRDLPRRSAGHSTGAVRGGLHRRRAPPASSCATSPFPLLAPAVTANTLLSIIGALQSYQLIYVLTGPINPATQVLSLAIFTQGFGGAQGGAVQSQGYAAAISMVQFVIVMIVSLATLAYLRRKETVAVSATRRRRRGRRRPRPAAPERPAAAPATARPVAAKVVLYALLVRGRRDLPLPVAVPVNTALKSNAEFFSDPTGLVQGAPARNFADRLATRATSPPTCSTASCTRSSRPALGTVMSLMVGVPGGPRLRQAYDRLWYGPVRCDAVPAQHAGHGVPAGAALNLYDTRAGLHPDHGVGRRRRARC